MKKSIVLGVVLVLIIFGLSFVPFKTKANIIGEGVDVGARLEVSKDDGATWYNYSADTNPGGQTLIAKPGDTLLFLGKVWEEGRVHVSNLTLSGILTHPEYFDTTSAFYQDDEDGNGIAYTGIVGPSTIGLPQIKEEFGNAQIKYESGTFKITLKNDIPDQTLIEGTFAVDSLSGPVAFNNPSFLNPVPKAIAQLQGTAISTVRILVNNPQPLPQTGANL